MNHESYQDELTRVRHAMDDAEDAAERECRYRQWLRLRKEERERQPAAVQALEGLCSAKQVIDAYGGFEAMLEAWIAESREKETSA